MYLDLLNRLLAKRGVVTPAAREAYLNPTYARDVHDPFLLKDIDKAVARISAALVAGEKIFIFADYDADGVPGAAILTEYFRHIDYTNFQIYIPDRQTEAHGLSLAFVEKAAREGAKLIITVDCGSTNLAEAALARELGLDLIITDHHLVPNPSPLCFALINPKQVGDAYPEKMLCGAGVAFKLVQALLRASALDPNFSRFTRLLTGSDTVKNLAPEPSLVWEKSLLDLVAIATITDRVPLQGENRTLAKFGLLMLARTRRPGLQALMDVAKLRRSFVTEDDVGFTLGPRINAAGRMTHASEALTLLTTADGDEAEAIALRLERQNAERRQLVDGILKKAQAQVSDDSPLVVLADEGWSPAVLGLAASRLVEKFSRPVFLAGRNEAGEWKGSCRSDGTVNLVALMTAANEGHQGLSLKMPQGESLVTPLFTQFGGHVMAGGFSLVIGKQSELAPRLLAAHTTLPKLPPVVSLIADTDLPIDEVTEGLWQTVAALAPFGDGNPKPLFSFSHLPLARVKTFGNGGIHLELGFMQSSGHKICAVGFFDTYPHLDLTVGRPINLLATLEKSYFRPTPELRLRIVDIKSAA